MIEQFQSECICLFQLIRACRETPKYVQYSRAFQAAAEQLRRSDNPAIRRTVDRLMPWYVSGGTGEVS